MKFDFTSRWQQTVILDMASFMSETRSCSSTGQAAVIELDTHAQREKEIVKEWKLKQTS